MKGQILKRSTNTDKPLIKDLCEDSLKSASYDLHLGDEYIKDGCFYTMNPSVNQYLEIPAHDVVIVSTNERINVPTDLVGRFGLRLSLVMKGLVLNNEPQIDPGYSGRLFCLLYNLTEGTIILAYRQPFATIEFETLEEHADPYRGMYQNVEHISEVAKEILPKSGLKELSERFKKTEAELTRKVERFYALFFTVITIIIAVLGILVSRILLGL